jgi:hypothetical protein
MKLFLFLVFALAVFARESRLSSILERMIERELAMEFDLPHANVVSGISGAEKAIADARDIVLMDMPRADGISGAEKAIARDIVLMNMPRADGVIGAEKAIARGTVLFDLPRADEPEKAIARENRLSVTSMRDYHGRRQLASETKLADILKSLIEESLARDADRTADANANMLANANANMLADVLREKAMARENRLSMDPQHNLYGRRN